ncbi:MAG: DUF1932 domain-containing protein [Pseudomonadota bacterium]
MSINYAFIGFGEAGRTFAGAASGVSMSAFDVKTHAPETAPDIRDAYEALGVAGADGLQDALASARCVFSLVTAGQALSAAKAVTSFISTDTIYCDMNSVAPETKRQAAEVIKDAGGLYADVAIMAPVHPKALDVPLLVSGSHADQASSALTEFGFSAVAIQSGDIGAASAVKMIRSVMVKGIEALTAECMLAAEAAGVRATVTQSLNASWPGTDWEAISDYNLDRMLTHGLRRAEEMGEVVKTLNGLGVSADMSSATRHRQHLLGEFGPASSAGLAMKLNHILNIQKDASS